VHVVYMAHFDVGYTSPNVEALLDVYATQYFPQVRGPAGIRPAYNML
jgi:hypothetical protein